MIFSYLDLRKIFITLAQESAYQLGASKHADKLIAYFRLRMHYYIKHCKNAVKVMVQLGFPESSVNRALKLKANNHKAALDWLIANETSSGYNENLESPRSSEQRRSILSTTYEPTGKLAERVEGLLEIVKFYAGKDELVDLKSFNDMVFMGYNAEVALEALRITRNNVASAVDFIHGDKNPSITELRDGLSKTSILRQKFLQSTQIQESFRQPQSFIFFINILDHPEQASSWNPFSEVGELMKQIIVKYHEEKQCLATNQFNDSLLPISALSAPN